MSYIWWKLHCVLKNAFYFISFNWWNLFHRWNHTFSSVKKKSAANWKSFFRSSIRAVQFASVSSCARRLLQHLSCRSLRMIGTTPDLGMPVFGDISQLLYPRPLTWQKDFCCFICVNYGPYTLLCKCSAVAETGDRLAARDMGRKLGGCAPFGGRKLRPHLTQRALGRGVPPYQVASSSIQPFGHNRHGPKNGAVLLFRGAGPLLIQCHIQCRLDRGLPLYQEASWSIQPFGITDMGRKWAPFFGQGKLWPI